MRRVRNSAWPDHWGFVKQETWRTSRTEVRAQGSFRREALGTCISDRLWREWLRPSPTRRVSLALRRFVCFPSLPQADFVCALLTQKTPCSPWKRPSDSSWLSTVGKRGEWRDVEMNSQIKYSVPQKWHADSEGTDLQWLKDHRVQCKGHKGSRSGLIWIWDSATLISWGDSGKWPNPVALQSPSRERWALRLL